jgi:hypothetical protein
MNTIVNDFAAIAARMSVQNEEIPQTERNEPPPVDAELIAMCAAFHEENALANARIAEADWRATLDRRWDLSDEIQDTPAQTLAGYRAKASVAVVMLWENNGSDEFVSGDAAFAYAALLDIAGRADV